MKKLLLSVMFLMAVAAATAPEARSQAGSDSKGTDFWLAFMPNFHPFNATATTAGDSLYIFIAAEKPTRGSIVYRSRVGAEFTHNFNITNPADVYTFSVGWSEFELRGTNDGGIFNGDSRNNERVTILSFHITSDEEVTVYGLSQARTTSDAFLVLPTDVLGNNYHVMSYNSDGDRSPTQGVGSNSTPSQFVIIGTEDQTQVRITPTVATHLNGTNVQNVVLNRGEVYLVQARINGANFTNDLTGSYVESSKPVALFAGHQRARIPSEGDGTSRDILIEQMPPLSAWGKSSFIIPYPLPPDAIRSGNDLFRVMAAFDSTDIFINNVLTAQLMKGQFYEGRITTAATVSASQPILVGQFKKTGGDNSGIFRQSDPFMMLIPPSEQFLPAYRCINAQGLEWYQTVSRQIVKEPSFQSHYITIIAPMGRASAVKLDGVVIDPSRLVPIPNSVFAYGWYPVSGGVHTVEADTLVGILVYGYGSANSYGYIGGMNFRKLDFNPPKVFYNQRCFGVDGIVFDTSVADSRLEAVRSTDDPVINTRVLVENFTPWVDSVRFSAELIDRFADGFFTLTAQDSNGLRTRRPIGIPGITVSWRKENTGTQILPFNQEFPVRRQYCLDLKLYNYGQFAQQIDTLLFTRNSPEWKIITQVPFGIAAGDSAVVRVCFFSDKQVLVSDTLQFNTACGNRFVYAFNGEAVFDRRPPIVTVEKDSCNVLIQITVSDSLPSDVGIDKIGMVPELSQNVQESFDEIIPDMLFRYRLSVINPYQDAWYVFRAIDAEGNLVEKTDTVRGLTIAVELRNSAEVLSFEPRPLGVMTCDTVTLYNYGMFPVNLDNTPLYINREFSVPQSQFPLTVIPGQRVSFLVCYSALSTKQTVPEDDEVGHPVFDRDTLIIAPICVQRLMAMQGYGLEFMQVTGSLCNTPIRFTTSKVPDGFSMGLAAPNPAVGATTLRFSVGSSETVKIDLYSITGALVQTVVNGRFESGSYELGLNVSALSAGAYYYVATTTDGVVTRPLIVQ